MVVRPIIKVVRSRLSALSGTLVKTLSHDDPPAALEGRSLHLIRGSCRPGHPLGMPPEWHDRLAGRRKGTCRLLPPGQLDPRD